MEAKKKIENTTKRRSCFLLLGPPTVLLYMGCAFIGPVFTDLIVYQTCLISLKINSTECLRLRTDAGSPEAMDLEAKVEPYASTVVMVKTLIESLLPAIVCLFLGPWSDRSGRRPLFLGTCIGCIITYVLLMFMCNWNTSPWYLLLALVPTNIAGGLSTSRLASICFISDTTAKEDRMLQLALLDVAIWCGLMVGGLATPLIYQNYSYMNIFSASAACCVMALACVYFLIPETVENTSKTQMGGLFKVSFVKELVTCAFMKREGFHRSIIWFAIMIQVSNNVISRGETSGTEFLFTRTRLGWNVENYSYYTVVDSALRITGLCAVFSRNCIPGVTDTLLATVSLVSCLGSAITRYLTWKSWHMYLSVCIGMFNQIAIPVMRAIITKFVDAQEVGKIFSLAALLEVLGSLAVTPLYTLLYTHYLPPIYPAPVYLFSITSWVLLILSVLCMEVLIRKSPKSSAYVATAQEDF